MLTVTENKTELSITNKNRTVVIKPPAEKRLTISKVGVKGKDGTGKTESQLSWDYFKDAGEVTKDDNLFPTLIEKGDYAGVTNATRVINRNISNDLIIDSVVDTYDFNGSNYVWTTPYLGGLDLLANRPGTPSVVIT